MTNRSHSLINKLDVKTDQEFAVTGNFDFTFDTPLSDNDEIFFPLGGIIQILTVSQLKKDIDFHQPFSFKIINQKLVMSCTIYDLEGKWVAEVENNKWRINKNNTGKFNYDNKGFEVFDNKGRIVMSLDIRKNKNIILQGVYVSPNDPQVTIMTPSTSLLLRSTNPSTDQKILTQIKNARFEQLFNYTGAFWHSSRKTK